MNMDNSDAQDFRVTSLYEVYSDESDIETRRERLIFHLKTGDYFAMLATILGFVEETLERAESKNLELAQKEAALARRLREDLIYLQEHYRIEEKNG